MIRKFIIIYILLIFVICIAECTIYSKMIKEYLCLSEIWSYNSKNDNLLIQAESQYLKVFSKFFFIVIIVIMYDN